MQALWLVVATSAAIAGCTSDPPPSCITVDTACAPLYAPSFENVYTRTLAPTCGSERSACHSAAGQQGGMSFEDPAHAYAALLDGRVVPGDPGCSEVIVRTSSPGADYQMPPGDPLREAERCALIQWIQGGAGSGQAIAPPRRASGEPPSSVSHGRTQTRRGVVGSHGGFASGAAL